MMTDIGEEAAVEVQPKIEQYESELNVDFTATTANLTRGILEVYQPPLEQVQKELVELINKQATLIDLMKVENMKLREVDENLELNELFLTIRKYQTKLANIKKEMVLVHDRTTKLKKRALHFQQVKQKEALHKEHQREQEVCREQELIGRPTTS